MDKVLELVTVYYYPGKDVDFFYVRHAPVDVSCYQLLFGVAYWKQLYVVPYRMCWYIVPVCIDAVELVVLPGMNVVQGFLAHSPNNPACYSV